MLVRGGSRQGAHIELGLGGVAVGGEAVVEVEVLEIDMGSSRVKVRIGGKDSLLSFN